MSGSKEQKLILIITTVVTVIAVVMNFTRCSYGNFWSDECHSILTARVPWGDLLGTVVGASHAPLYFIFLKVLILIFGENSVTYYLSSFIPYLLFLILIMTSFRKRFGNLAALLMTIFVSLSTNSYVYIGEIRMYEICACSVFAAFLMFYEIINKESLKTIYCLHCSL